METDWFFPHSGCQPEPIAIWACEHCPVIGSCSTHALNYEAHGYWAGMNETTRKKMRTRTGIRLQPVDPPEPRHGTYGAYIRHIRRGEDACQPCKDVNARRKTPYPVWPGDPGVPDEAKVRQAGRVQ